MDTLRKEILGCARTQVRSLEDEQGYELTFCFGADFTGFSGHFPGHPVLPAFVQILTGQCAEQIRSGSSRPLRELTRAKFIKTIGPDEPVRVRWRQNSTDGGGLRGHFTLSAGGQRAASFTIELGPEESPDA